MLVELNERELALLIETLQDRPDYKERIDVRGLDMLLQEAIEYGEEQ